MISLLNNGCHTTFDRTGSIDKNRRPGFSLTEGLSAELAVAHVCRPKEGEGQVLLFLAEHIKREGLSRLHSLVSTGIGLVTHDHEGRSERHALHAGAQAVLCRSAKRNEIVIAIKAVTSALSSWGGNYLRRCSTEARSPVSYSTTMTP